MVGWVWISYSFAIAEIVSYHHNFTRGRIADHYYKVSFFFPKLGLWLRLLVHLPPPPPPPPLPPHPPFRPWCGLVMQSITKLPVLQDLVLCSHLSLFLSLSPRSTTVHRCTHNPARPVSVFTPPPHPTPTPSPILFQVLIRGLFCFNISFPFPPSLPCMLQSVIINPSISRPWSISAPPPTPTPTPSLWFYRTGLVGVNSNLLTYPPPPPPPNRVAMVYCSPLSHSHSFTVCFCFCPCCRPTPPSPHPYLNQSCPI